MENEVVGVVREPDDHEDEDHDGEHDRRLLLGRHGLGVAHVADCFVLQNVLYSQSRYF